MPPRSRRCSSAGLGRTAAARFVCACVGLGRPAKLNVPASVGPVGFRELDKISYLTASSAVQKGMDGADHRPTTLQWSATGRRQPCRASQKSCLTRFSSVHRPDLQPGTAGLEREHRSFVADQHDECACGEPRLATFERPWGSMNRKARGNAPKIPTLIKA